MDSSSDSCMRPPQHPRSLYTGLRTQATQRDGGQTCLWDGLQSCHQPPPATITCIDRYACMTLTARMCRTVLLIDGISLASHACRIQRWETRRKGLIEHVSAPSNTSHAVRARTQCRAAMRKDTDRTEFVVSMCLVSSGS